jgi:hypothetical protein
MATSFAPFTDLAKPVAQRHASIQAGEGFSGDQPALRAACMKRMLSTIARIVMVVAAMTSATTAFSEGQHTTTGNKSDNEASESDPGN